MCINLTIVIQNTYPASGMVLRDEREIMVTLLHNGSKNKEMYVQKKRKEKIFKRERGHFILLTAGT